MLVNGYVLAKCKVSDHKWINQIDRMFKGTYCVISMNSLPIFSFSKRVCFCLFLVSLFSPSDASPKVIQRHIEIPSSGFLGNMRICPGRFRRNSIVCWLRTWAAMPKLTTWIKHDKMMGLESYRSHTLLEKTAKQPTKLSGLEGHPTLFIWGFPKMVVYTPKTPQNDHF